MGDTPRRFYMYRGVDVTGVSGPGLVAWGVTWPDGTVAIRWCAEGNPSSTVIWDSIGEAVKVHGHDGKTEFIYLDEISVRTHNGVPV